MIGPRPLRPWLVAALVALALGVLLTLRLTSTVTSPVGGYTPVGPGSPASTGTAGPTGTVPSEADLRGEWRPRVVLAEPVPAALAGKALLVVHDRQGLMGASDGCNTHTLVYRLGGDGGFSAREQSVSLVRCPERVRSARALTAAAGLRLVDGRLHVLADDGRLLAVFDRVRG